VLERHGIASAIIPNVVDLKLFRPRSRPVRTRRNHIVITRNLEIIYGIDDALRAFQLIAARHEDARLTIAGDGPERERLMRLAADLGIDDKVHFTGGLTKEEIASLYQQADIMLNPSRIDNMPNAILEAYACAIPVVSTNVGGIPFVARDSETALLVDVGDSSALAERVCTLIEDDELALRLSQNGLREARQYSWEAVRDQWLQMYAAVTAPDGVSERI
jgi:glycosyltransferase involved in cell wall biosynthesis